MGATQLVSWTLEPSLAIAADGRVVAVNEACARLVGRPAAALLGRWCSEVVSATDITGARVCRPADCPTLAALAAGEAVGLPWCGWQAEDGSRLPVAATAIAFPPEERADGAAAVILLHLDGRPTALHPPGWPEDTWPHIRVRLLGRPECWRDDVRQPVRRRRVFELLAMLALAGDTGMPRDRICEALWPDALPGNGRAHLRVLLHSLRQMLGPEVVDAPVHAPASREVLRLGAQVWTDIVAFEAGAAARRECRAGPPETAAAGEQRLEEIDELVALYRGDLDDAGGFGTWSAVHRERLRSRVLALLAEAAPLAAYLGQPDRAVAYCRRAVVIDPLHEGFQVALITAYSRLGQRAEAAAQYRAYRRLLQDELSLQPSLVVERALREVV